MPFNMAQLTLLSVISLTFLMMAGPSQAQGTLVVEPEEKYFLQKKQKHVMIECEARGASDITFTCAGEQIPESSVEGDDDFGDVISRMIRVTRNDMKHSRKRLSPGEDFWCQCSAVDLSGNIIQTSRRGVVLIAKMTKRFHRQPENVQVVEGQTAVFKCSPPDAQPKPTIMWKKNKKRLHVADDARISINEDGSLVIQNVGDDDVAMYSCVARNSAGRRESNAARLDLDSEGPSTTTTTTTLSPFDPTFPDVIPETLSIVSDLKSMYEVEKDGSVTLSCSFSMTIRLLILCNRRRLPLDEIKVTERKYPGTDKTVMLAQYDLPAADIINEGYFCQCEAWALEDRKWKSVKGEKAFFKITEESDDRSFIEDNFLEEPQSAIANDENEVVFRCQPPVGLPVPTVYWMKNGKRINPAVDKQFFVDGNDLIIDPVKVSDAGMYTCVAGNSAGVKRSRPAQLRVEVIQDDFMEEPQSAVATDGNEVTLRCKPPVGNPVPTVYWMKDEKRIRPEEDRQFYVDENNNLVIAPVRVSDTGLYTCVAENSAGKKRSAPAQLTVELPGTSRPSCEQMIAKCDQMLVNQDNVTEDSVEDSCREIHQCLDYVENECNTDNDVMDKVQVIRKELNDICNQIDNFVECPALFTCLQNFNGILSFSDLCRTQSNKMALVTCMNSGLEGCNININQRNDKEITDMLEHICNILDKVDDSCQSSSECTLQVTPVEKNNHQYWCRILNSGTDCLLGFPLGECVMENNLQELGNGLRDLRCTDNSVDVDGSPTPEEEYTASATNEVGNPTPEPEAESTVHEDMIKPEKEGNVDSKPKPTDGDPSTNEPEATTEVDDNMDMDKEHESTSKQMEESPESPTSEAELEKTTEAEVEPVVNEPESGSSIAMTSILLTTCMQLILATLLSWR